MVNYTIFNGTDAEFTNVNGGGTDVPARSKLTGVTLTDAELAAVCVLNGSAVMQDAPTAAEQGAVAAAVLDAIIADIDLSTKKKVDQFKIRRAREDMADIARALA